MSDASRSLLSPGLTLVVGLVVGGLAGVYATRLLDGEAPKTVDPSPTPVRECPPCEACPRCPPPPDCGEVSVVPSTPDDPPPAAEDDPIDDDIPVDIEPSGPGLSAKAIQEATAAVRLNIAPCLEGDAAARASGMLLLDLTITATGSEGFVTDALITTKTGDTEAVEACVEREAGRARFPHAGPDGEQRVKLPVKIGSY